MERYNLIEAEAIEKTLEDEKIRPRNITVPDQFVLKNALQNILEHSPNELVFWL